VSARELHERLEIGTHFKDWFPRICEYGFEEKRDYTPLNFEHPQNKQLTTDYLLSIDMAKEICMLQRTDKGKECRKYFLDLEKAWNTPEQIIARALKFADKKISELQTSNLQLASKVEEDKPKVIFADAVTASYTSILIGELAKIIKQNGIDIGEKRLFEWLRNNGYLIKRKGADWNMPTQKSMDLEIFEVQESVKINPDGTVRNNKTTKVTGKGQQYFVNKFIKKGE
jgi:anti-repressor protein